MNINPENYTRFYRGDQIGVASLSDGKGMTAILCGHGARLVSLTAHDEAGNPYDAVLGYPDLDGYLGGQSEMGAMVGRVANRIAKGRFKIGPKTCQLEKNDGDNHLHGGFGGAMRRVFGVYQEKDDEARFRTRLADGEDGYPGNLDIDVTYALTGDRRLRMTISATTDEVTPVSLCNHSYFNLSGEPTIENHELAINAEFYTPVDNGLIPLGTIEPVEGTPFDFTASTRIGDRIDSDHPQLHHGLGYDHNFVLRRPSPVNKYGEFWAATLRDPASGRTMEVWTTEPGLQFYSGNLMGRDKTQGRFQGRTPLVRRSGLCLETQRFPDSVNQKSFPDIMLRPGERWVSSTSLVFGGRP